MPRNTSRHSSSDSESLSLSFSSDSSDSSLEVERHKLTKRELKKLVKIQRQIKKEESLLKRKRGSKDSKIKKQAPKREESSVERSYENMQGRPIIQEGKKLFVTAIDEKYTHEEVMKELNGALNSIYGVVDFRIKKKPGSKTYAFIDFANNYDAKEALAMLKKRKLFGEKMAVYYSQDELKSKLPDLPINKSKKCFECNEEGHFARECRLRLKDESRPLSDSYSQLDFNPPALGFDIPETNHEPFLQSREEEPSFNKRIIRDRSRLHRLGS